MNAPFPPEEQDYEARAEIKRLRALFERANLVYFANKGTPEEVMEYLEQHRKEELEFNTQLATEVENLTRERDEAAARMEVQEEAIAILVRELDEVRKGASWVNDQWVKCRDKREADIKETIELTKERDEARAEVERLRPLAEVGAAVERLEKWRNKNIKDLRWNIRTNLSILERGYTVTLTQWDGNWTSEKVAGYADGDTLPAAVEAALEEGK